MNTITAKVTYFLLTVAIGMFIVIGCGNSSKSTNPPPPTHSANFHNISIVNLAFSPAALTIPAGDTVLWTNHDGFAHTVTSDTGTELAGNLGSGGTYQHIFATAGSFAYHCTIHPTIHGSVTVH